MRLHVRKINVVTLTPETMDFIWCLSSSLSLSVGFSIQDEPMDVARSAPQGAHYHADVIYLLPSLLLLLFRHSAKSSITQEERLIASQN